VVALSDRFPSYTASCGRCYEIRCNPAVVKDGLALLLAGAGMMWGLLRVLLAQPGPYSSSCHPSRYGKTFDRKEVCYNPDQTLLVRVVDSCPCSYPANW
jgi:hypothetical protein